MGQTVAKDSVLTTLVAINYPRDVAGIISDYCRDDVWDFNLWCLNYAKRHPYHPPDLGDVRNGNIRFYFSMEEERVYHRNQIKYALSKCIYFTVIQFCQLIEISWMEFRAWHYGIFNSSDVHEKVMYYLERHSLIRWR